MIKELRYFREVPTSDMRTVVDRQPTCMGQTARGIHGDGVKRTGAPGVHRGKAARKCSDRHAGRTESVSQAVHGRRIINLQPEPMEARPSVVPCARAIAVPDVDGHVVVIATRGHEGRRQCVGASHRDRAHRHKTFPPRRYCRRADGCGRRAILPTRWHNRDRRTDLADDRVDVERIGFLIDFAVAAPRLARPVGIDLDAVAFGIVEIDGFAHIMIGGAGDGHADFRGMQNPAGEVGARRHQERDVIEAGFARIVRQGIGPVAQLEQSDAAGAEVARLVAVRAALSNRAGLGSRR